MSYFDNAKAVTFGGKTVTKLQLAGKTIWELVTKTFTNLVPTSIDLDGSIYNGVGYKTEYRISTSSGKESSGGTNGTLTGFIKVNPGDVVRFASKGKIINWFVSNATNIFAYYDSSRGTRVGHAKSNGTSNAYNGICNASNSTVTEEVYRQKYRITVPNDSSIEWIRVCVYGPNGAAGADLIVTVNEEIT